MDIHHAPDPAQIKATLYFGANVPNGDYVTDALFAQFLEDEITPQFPGFTVMHGQGYWKGKPEIVRALSILAPDTNDFRGRIRAFAERYKTRFHQEAVAYDFTSCEFTLDCWPYGPVAAYHRTGKGY
jgi:hypothetical protein